MKTLDTNHADTPTLQETSNASISQKDCVAEGKELPDTPPKDPGTPFYKNLHALSHVSVQVSAVLGRISMPIEQLLKLGRGSVLELERYAGDPIEIYVNNRLLAKGELIVLDEREGSPNKRLGITLTELTDAGK